MSNNNEVHKLLTNLDHKKGTGRDGISARMLKLLLVFLLYYLCCLIRLENYPWLGGIKYLAKEMGAVFLNWLRLIIINLVPHQ